MLAINQDFGLCILPALSEGFPNGPSMDCLSKRGTHPQGNKSVE